ncbi:uncharacterized protein LOC143300325 [Babylonia areolata]|uniref:uncharacterized protein LOC143300325 n=1 Tax=Babylonia areolata TaxID=304850 RepID=UPI003FD5016A
MTGAAGTSLPQTPTTNLNAARGNQQQARHHKRYVFPDPPQVTGQGQGQAGRTRRASIDPAPQPQPWLDTYPRPRLHTVSGSGNDLQASLHSAMARVQVSSPGERTRIRGRGRAMSLKKPRKKTAEGQPFRPRTCSLPARNPYSSRGGHPPEGEVYTLRSFLTTRKGQLVKRGDSLKSRSSNASVRSSGSVTDLPPPPPPSSSSPYHHHHHPPPSSSNSSHAASSSLSPYKVLMVGAEGVGKSSLTRQFSTSEYLGPFDHTADGEKERLKVSLLIDGEESTVHVLDFCTDVWGDVVSGVTWCDAASGQWCDVVSGVAWCDAVSGVTWCDAASGQRCDVSTDDPVHLAVSRVQMTLWTSEYGMGEVGVDGYVVVFGMDSRVSFDRATDVLYELRHTRSLHCAVILVANKCDLVRSQEVTTQEARSVAATYDSKYIETSVVLNHNVDELLVGIVTQIRLLAAGTSSTSTCKVHCPDSEHVTCYSKSKTLLHKFFRKKPISKSCDNLYVL